LVYGIDLSDGERKIHILDPDTTTAQADIESGNFLALSLADNCVIGNATSIFGVEARFIEYITNDDGDITYINVRDDDEYQVLKNIPTDSIELVSTFPNPSIKIDGTVYDFDDNLGSYSSLSRGIATSTEAFSVGEITRPANSGFLQPADSASTVLATLTAMAGGSDTEDIAVLPADLQKMYMILALNYASTGELSYWGGTPGQQLDDWLYQVGGGGDVGEIILNEDGDIAYLKGIVWPTQATALIDEWNDVSIGVVDKVTEKSAKISFNNGAAAIDLDEEDSDSFIILKNGVPATVAQIEPGDFVYEVNKYNIRLILDVSMTFTGTLESYETYDWNGLTFVKNVVIDGKAWTVAQGGGWISDDDGDSYDQMLYYTSPYGTTDTLSDLDDMLGEEVSCNLNPIGKIAAIRSASAGDSGKIYGVVNDDDVQTLVNGQLTDALEVLKADGSLATYAPDSDSEYYTADDWETLTDTVIGTTVLRGDFVEISLNSDGYIDQLKHNTAITDNKVIAAGTDVTGDQDTDVITIGSDSYDASDTVIFDLTTGSDDYELGSLPDFMDKIDDADLSFTTATIAKLKDGEVKYLLLKDSALISTDVKLAMIAKTGVDSDA
jgi:hypothetical protein